MSKTNLRAEVAREIRAQRFDITHEGVFFPRLGAIAAGFVLATLSIGWLMSASWGTCQPPYLLRKLRRYHSRPSRLGRCCLTVYKYLFLMVHQVRARMMSRYWSLARQAALVLS